MSETSRTYPNPAFMAWRLVLTVARQAAACPVFDGCSVWTAEGWQAGGWAIRVHSGPGRALVLAWRGRGGPSPATIRRLCSTPGIGRLFRARTGR